MCHRRAPVRCAVRESKSNLVRCLPSIMRSDFLRGACLYGVGLGKLGHCLSGGTPINGSVLRPDAQSKIRLDPTVAYFGAKPCSRGKSWPCWAMASSYLY